jgi:hypothetical protein
MLNVKGKLQILENAGARFVEIINGDGKGEVGITFNYNDSFMFGTYSFPNMTIAMTTVHNEEYVIGKRDVKLISLEEFMEKGNLNESKAKGTD